MKPLTPDGRSFMETFQKVLQFLSLLTLTLVAWIANDALGKLTALESRMAANEKDDAVRDARLNYIERLNQ